MTQMAKVLSRSGGEARVMILRQSACSGDCHKCSGCGAVEQTVILSAENPIGADAGDLVILEARSGPVLKAAALLYLLPVALLIAGYLVGMQWKLGGLTGGLAFAGGIGLVIAYDRLVMRKTNTVYTITGFGKKTP